MSASLDKLDLGKLEVYRKHVVNEVAACTHSDAASSRLSDEFKDLIRELTTEFKKLTEKVENLERTQ
ncbi:hypothetical protein FRC04_006819 [Tulasnella sp. 424]|nr:hypothetical protein FRC04_006819 [Tulasnella sp. 424]KAG8960498.1 hypothetical protein FRC05_006832 [Tulasnella sp. 425]